MFTTNSRLKSVRVIKITGHNREDVESKARLIAIEKGYLAYKLERIHGKSRTKLVGVFRFFDFT